MCCLFGLLDYKNVFSSNEKNLIISALSIEAEIRGTDATGIAYNANNRLCIYKRALPAHTMNYVIPNSAKYIMSHVRMTTQGSEKQNFNNHPFIGSVQSSEFALAHNGIINNDTALRKKEALPCTRIKTDSYIAVQLIERQNALNFGSLKNMAEKVEGSFCFTVLDNKDNLYIVRGNNPFCLYHFPKHGFYIYASTNEILDKALKKLGIEKLTQEEIVLSCGDILRIDRHGKIKCSSFDIVDAYEWYNSRNYGRYESFQFSSDNYQDEIINDYLQNLKSVAYYYGYSPSDIDLLLSEGFSYEEIEDMMHGSYFEFDTKERL